MTPSSQDTSEVQRPFVTKEALARRYGVCDRTIEKWMKAGILIFLKVNRLVRFHVEGCDETCVNAASRVEPCLLYRIHSYAPIKASPRVQPTSIAVECEAGAPEIINGPELPRRL